MSEQLTMPGMPPAAELPRRHNRHTGGRWRDAELRAACVAAVRSGVVCVSELRRRFGLGRNTLAALLASAEFAPGEVDEIRRRARLLERARALALRCKEVRETR